MTFPSKKADEGAAETSRRKSLRCRGSGIEKITSRHKDVNLMKGDSRALRSTARRDVVRKHLLEHPLHLRNDYISIHEKEKFSVFVSLLNFHPSQLQANSM